MSAVEVLAERPEGGAAAAVIGFLKSNGGFCRKSELLARFPRDTVQMLLVERTLFEVRFTLKRGTGKYLRKIHHLIFGEEFSKKTYVCLGRTGVVRLMRKALRKPENAGVRKTMTRFLSRYLTRAERVAVLWSLGIRNFRGCSSIVIADASLKQG